MMIEVLNCFRKMDLNSQRMMEILLLILKQACGLKDCMAVMLNYLKFAIFQLFCDVQLKFIFISGMNFKEIPMW